MMCGGQSGIESNAQLLAYTPYFEKIKKSAHQTTMLSVPPTPTNFERLKQSL
jgi:phosphopantothenoylcysteine synthetase/decarboxylase